MRKVAIAERARGRVAAQDYTFTVIFEPLRPATRAAVRPGLHRSNGSQQSGYQVTVPLLPGLITYGRTLAEARDMARDAIRCHLEGLQKDGEPIPNEKAAIKEKLRVAISA
jgi:antitoxin HicB